MAKTTSKNKSVAKKTGSKSAAKKTTASKTVKSKTVAAKKTGTKTKSSPKATKKTVAKKASAKKVESKAKPKTTTQRAKTSATKTKATKATRTTRKTTSTTKTGRKVEIVATTTKPPKKIKGYSKKELNEFKNVILEKRTEIIDQLQNLKDQMMDTTTGQYVNENSPYSLHMAEQGTDAQEREKLYLWAQRETKFLGYLEDALQRIENGTYGICIDSLELKEGPHLIPKNRLLAVPHTQHCVDCKNKKKK
jgi:RNA polymerase-binding transcription factor DksA